MASEHPAQKRYPPELRERAVRMVAEAIEAQGGERFGVITRVARQLGIGTESLRNWVRQAEIDGGQRPGTSTEDSARIAALEKENRELRRANEILKSAAVCVSRMRGRKRCRRSSRPSNAAWEMEVGPPQPPCRRRLQTTARCVGQEPGC